MKRIYSTESMGPKWRDIARQADEICQQYARQGLSLTVRQVYYQFVSRDLFPASWADKQTGSTNNMRSYQKLCRIINDGRMLGLIDWDHITDRTRGLESLSTWLSPRNIVDACASQFRLDLWRTQKKRVEVWIEKDALVGVIEGVCQRHRVPYLSCRGYTSQSVMHATAQRLRGYMEGGQAPLVLHFGDHDPSGMDMTRDIQDRLNNFIEYDWLYKNMEEKSATVGEIRASMLDRCGVTGVEIRRLALTMDQVQQYNPPPNPAKTTDSRYRKYADEHGNESWELDALEPTVLQNLIESSVVGEIDQRAWMKEAKQENAHKDDLRGVCRYWSPIVSKLRDGGFAEDE